MREQICDGVWTNALGIHFHEGCRQPEQLVLVMLEFFPTLSITDFPLILCRWMGNSNSSFPYLYNTEVISKLCPIEDGSWIRLFHLG